jgi:hypothetical protein
MPVAYDMTLGTPNTADARAISGPRLGDGLNGSDAQ